MTEWKFPGCGPISVSTSRPTCNAAGTVISRCVRLAHCKLEGRNVRAQLNKLVVLAQRPSNQLPRHSQRLDRQRLPARPHCFGNVWDAHSIEAQQKQHAKKKAAMLAESHTSTASDCGLILQEHATKDKSPTGSFTAPPSSIIQDCEHAKENTHNQWLQKRHLTTG